MASPQTTREALIAELLGDVGVLLEKADELRAAFPAAADEAAARVRTASERALQEVATASVHLARELTAHQEKLLHGVQTAAKEAQVAAKVVDGHARRFALLALLAGLGGGVIGGVLGGLALSRYIFGA